MVYGHGIAQRSRSLDRKHRAVVYSDDIRWSYRVNFKSKATLCGICRAPHEARNGLKHLAFTRQFSLAFARFDLLAELALAFARFESLGRPARGRSCGTGEGVGRKASVDHKLNVLNEGFLVGHKVDEGVCHLVEPHGFAPKCGARIPGNVLAQRGVGDQKGRGHDQKEHRATHGQKHVAAVEDH